MYVEIHYLLNNCVCVFLQFDPLIMYPEVYIFFFFFKQKTAYDIGLGIPAEPLFRSNPQCLASISRWITASSSWKRFCLFVCRALSSIMVICMLTAIRLLLTFVMSLYLLLRS